MAKYDIMPKAPENRIIKYPDFINSLYRKQEEKLNLDPFLHKVLLLSCHNFSRVGFIF